MIQNDACHATHRADDSHDFFISIETVYKLGLV